MFARAYGISLALNSLVFFAATTQTLNVGLAPFVAATGIRLTSLPGLLLGVSLTILAILGVSRYRARSSALRAVRVPKQSMLVLLLGLVFAALVLSQFIKYPIFPKSYSVDFLQHFQIMLGVVHSEVTPASGLLYYGVHYNLAMGYLLVGGDPFVQIQYLMAILMAPSSLVVYEGARAIYKNGRLGITGQVLFIASGFLWYLPLYDTGLYPNVYAIVLSIAYMVELQNLLDGKGVGRFLPFLVLALGLYFSHYFAPIFIAAVAVGLILGAVLKFANWRTVIAAIGITLAPSSVLALRPDLLTLASNTLRGGNATGAFTFSTGLADAFAFNPFLRYAIAEIYNLGSLVILFAVPLSIYYMWTNRRDAWLSFVLPLWLLILWLLAPNAELAWRFSFQALAPLILLAPATFHQAPPVIRWLLGREDGKRRRRGGGGFKESSFSTAGTAIVLFLLVFGGSWTYIMLSDLSLDVSTYSGSQVDLYDSMIWFQNNTPKGSSLLSVTDWRIAFLHSVTGRSGQVIFLAPAADAIRYAKSNGYSYLLVTYFIPADVPAGTDLTTFFSSFTQDEHLMTVYQHGQDVIFQIVK